MIKIPMTKILKIKILALIISTLGNSCLPAGRGIYLEFGI
jgi:hypothetical protein